MGAVSLAGCNMITSEEPSQGSENESPSPARPKDTAESCTNSDSSGGLQIEDYAGDVTYQVLNSAGETIAANMTVDVEIENTSYRPRSGVMAVQLTTDGDFRRRRSVPVAVSPETTESYQIKFKIEEGIEDGVNLDGLSFDTLVRESSHGQEFASADVPSNAESGTTVEGTLTFTDIFRNRPVEWTLQLYTDVKSPNWHIDTLRQDQILQSTEHSSTHISQQLSATEGITDISVTLRGNAPNRDSTCPKTFNFAWGFVVLGPGKWLIDSWKVKAV
jgi:hypothetical protein